MEIARPRVRKSERKTKARPLKRGFPRESEMRFSQERDHLGAIMQAPQESHPAVTMKAHTLDKSTCSLLAARAENEDPFVCAKVLKKIIHAESERFSLPKQASGRGSQRDASPQQLDAGGNARKNARVNGREREKKRVGETRMREEN